MEAMVSVSPPSNKVIVSGRTTIEVSSIASTVTATVSVLVTPPSM
jgi:hypothetical protein